MARNRKQTKKGTRQPRRVRNMRVGRPVLDKPGLDYAKLLADPCGENLVHPVYQGGSGGYLLRVETDAIHNTDPTDSGSMGFFCPGNIHDTATLGGFGKTGVPVASDSLTYNLLPFNSLQPGYAFLKANSASHRCVAACLQVSYPGSELSRAGIVGLGQANYSSLVQTPKSTSQLRAMAQHVRRMPDGVLEIVLVPNTSSQKYTNASDTSAATIDDDMPTLFWSAYGIPVSTGIRVRCVAIYEWLPINTTGVNLPTPSLSSSSRNTLNDVLLALEETGDWTAKGFMQAAKTISSLGAAAMNGAALYRGVSRAGRAIMA